MGRVAVENDLDNWYELFLFPILNMTSLHPLPLADTRIAVLVESQYIPAELQAYQRHFGALGAQVERLANLARLNR
jgi:hypothetical protein